MHRNEYFFYVSLKLCIKKPCRYAMSITQYLAATFHSSTNASKLHMNKVIYRDYL